jgi:UDP-glucose 4-epimerase
MNVMHDKRVVLVTGSSGFLGAHILRGLRLRGWTALEVPRAACLPHGTVSERSGRSRSSCDPLRDLEAMLSRTRPYALVHAAGSASVPASMADPQADFESSALLLIRVLDSLRRNSPDCRVVMLSSAAVYGNAERIPITETTPLKPISPYGFHKIVCETLAQEFHSVYGLPICAVRIFSAYGQGLRKQVLWDIGNKAFKKGTVRLLGTGRESRDFIHVSDIVLGIATLLERGEFRSEVYNLAGGSETTISRIAHLLVDALGVSSRIEFEGSQRPGDPIRWVADMSRLSGLGFKPRISIEEGISLYAEWLQKDVCSGSAADEDRLAQRE